MLEWFLDEGCATGLYQYEALSGTTGYREIVAPTRDIQQLNVALNALVVKALPATDYTSRCPVDIYQRVKHDFVQQQIIQRKTDMSMWTLLAVTRPAAPCGNSASGYESVFYQYKISDWLFVAPDVPIYTLSRSAGVLQTSTTIWQKIRLDAAGGGEAL